MVYSYLFEPSEFPRNDTDPPPRKRPWRLSPHQKLRHRRRLRRVDNIVAVLDNALKRSAASISSQSSKAAGTQLSVQSPVASSQPAAESNASASELSATAEGRRLLASHSSQEARRHGRGPRQGEMVPETVLASEATPDPPTLLRPSGTPLGAKARVQGTFKLLERWKAEMPTEVEMLPKDKYTIFDRKVRGYRKGLHKLPKWTRLSQRVNPPGF